MTNTLEIDSVILEFDTKRILQDVYLKTETGKITGLLGRNGTGKSCLMKIIFGEISPNDKSIRLNGKSIYSNYRDPAEIRYLPQGCFVPKSLSIQQIFTDFELDFNDFTNEFPDFGKLFKTKFQNLSGGEQRIVEIYAILVSKTKFCLLDEPFSQVMPLHIESIKNLIVREKINKGIIITDYLYRYILDICDNLYIISNGKTHLTKSIKDIETLGYANLTASNPVNLKNKA